jgi:dTDP-glucose pyrophosphorylase
MINNKYLTVDSSIKDAIKVIESVNERLAIVFDHNGKVLGALTDGDIRRAILNGISISDFATKAMNSNPVIANIDDSEHTFDQLLEKNNIRSILLLDSNDLFIKTYSGPSSTNTNIEASNSIKNTFSFAVIMAGGEGTRLRPITSTLPKPMIDINGTPLLERQIKNLRGIGIKKIYISVNYLGKVIQDYFGDGRKWGVQIDYLKEDKKLGTAGGLSLIGDIKDSINFLVINGDILTESNLLNLYHFHKEYKSQVTIGAVNHHVRIPYGVIKQKSGRMIELIEKPVESYLCNAGIYALTSKALKAIPKRTFWNMTDLIDHCLLMSEVVSVFPVHEYWSDIGTPSDLEKARKNTKSNEL